VGFSLFVGIALFAWLLARQLRVRRVWPRVYLRFSVILCVIGLVQLLDEYHAVHVKPGQTGILLLGFAIGAVGLGALRALTVKIRRTGPFVLQQGTWLTVVLWLVSLGVHFGTAWWLHGPSSLESSSLLLYLGLTYGAQNLVVHRRAGFVTDWGPPPPPGIIDADSDVVP
jgi:hypothetical protein